MDLDEDIRKYLNKLSKISVIFLRVNFQHLPDIVYINKVSLPENYRRSTFIALYRLFRDISYVALSKPKGMIIGYILNKLDEGFSFFQNRIVKKGHIFSVAVLPDFRRHGVGWGLVALGLHSMLSKNVEEVYLEVRKSNYSAIELYKKFGMDVVGVVNKYYEDGEDAYVMAAPVQKFETIIKKIIEEFTKQDLIGGGE